jgi:lipopolysaccharide/colanic/teichoic acid biosynthesis glycosyltransferase
LFVTAEASAAQVSCAPAAEIRRRTLYEFIKRIIDVLLAGTALVFAGPVLLLAALGIRLSNGAPVFYRASRVGRNGTIFTMYKLRTMIVKQDETASLITSLADPRLFPLGSWLRRMKLDELPQLLNILKGDMAIVGPRPEDPAIVKRHYAPDHHETLRMLPGLTSPGTVYYMTRGEANVDGKHPEHSYAANVLPVKLALDTVYVRQASLLYDLRIILQTVLAAIKSGLGKQTFSEPLEMEQAKPLITPAQNI